ncbi:MAG TPA: thrombospondin type 3 repeat-containing protein [Opitutales bacterium]|nr:thrombospondin type 3 repeat-containing protein [Opitutales bacterium]
MIRRTLLPFKFHRNLLILPILVGLPATLLAQPISGFVSETDTEFQTVADVDGDGYPDLIVVDKETGQFRIADGDANGEIVWREFSGDSGLADLTGFSAGPVRVSNRDALLFVEPFANRMHLIEPIHDQPLTEPEFIGISAVGPTLVTTIDIPGEADYDPDLLDILYHSTLEGPLYPNVASAFRSRSGPFGSFGVQIFQAQMKRPNRVLLEDGTDPAYGVLEERGNEEAFRLFDLSSTTSFMDEIDEVSPLPRGSRYLYADFDNDGRAEMVFFKPGSDIIYESGWNGSALNALSSFSIGEPIVDIRLIESSGNPELFIIVNDGTSAIRADYDGDGKVTLLENFSTNSENIFTGAFSLGDKLHLIQGTPNGISVTHHTYEFDGSGHSAIGEQSLTPLKSPEIGSSVLLFDQPPLTDPDARLIGKFDAGTWTSAFTLQSGGATVSSEFFQSAAAGLGAKRTVTIQDLPTGTTGGLTNQIASDLSLIFQDRPLGKVSSELTLEPKSGTYSHSIRPTLSIDHPGAVFYYRTSNDSNWIEGTPPVMSSDTTLYAIAVVPQVGWTNIVKGEYSFTEDPGNLDSRGDGIPDFVKKAFGLDPLSPDFDSDGDGFTDLEELLAGTDPNDPNDYPSRNDVGFQFPNSFDLVAAPAIPDPANPTNKLRSLTDDRSTEMTVHQPNGFSLGKSQTESTAYLSDAAAVFEAVDIADSDLFVIVTTESNFWVHSGDPQDYGRQVARLVPIPKQEYEPFVYNDFGQYGGLDSVTQEAKAWLGAARTYYNNLQREVVVVDPVDPESTLVALLVEKTLGELLHERKLTDRGNISLTPFRSAENPLAPNEEDDPISPSRMRSVAHNDLLALQRNWGDDFPSFKISEIIGSIENAVAASSSSGISNLVELTNRLYLASATNANAGALRQPFDALRRFLQSGTLDNTGYEELPQFPASLLTSAEAGVAEIMNGIERREKLTVSLIYEGLEKEVENQLLTGLAPVYRGADYSSNYDPDNPVILGRYILIDDQNSVYPIARAFPLTTGSLFRVSGFVEGVVGDELYLEVTELPKLLFVNNANPVDLDGNLIPDSIEELFQDTSLSPFLDSDGDGYSDLQEILDGSDPTDPNSIPKADGNPLPAVDLSPPQVLVEKTETGTYKLSFDFPANYRKHFEFELHASDDLRHFESTGLKANGSSGSTNSLHLSSSFDREFYIFQMKLK